MTEREIEELLSERAERLANALPVSASAEKRLRREIELDARSQYRRILRIRQFAGVLVAAAIIVLFAKPWSEQSYGPAECRLTLLDLDGREFDTAVRSDESDSFVRPGVVLVEIVAKEMAFFSIRVIDPNGYLRALDVVDEQGGLLQPGQDKIVRLDLGGFEARSLGNSEISVLLISSQLEIPSDRIDESLPQKLAELEGEAREIEISGVAATVGRELGCRVSFSTFALERQK